MEKRTNYIGYEKLDKLLSDAMKKNVFSACSVGYCKINKQVMEGELLHYGWAGAEKSRSVVDDNTVFDLASLTKPLVTSLSMLALIEEKRIHINENMANFFTARVPCQSKITLLHLLNHSSGLPAHRPYYKKLMSLSFTERMDFLVAWIMEENLLFTPGTEHIYSDLGFMLLGRIIEKVSGESLDEYWRRKIVLPLSLEKDLFFAGKQKIGSRVYVPTGKCVWSKTRLCGEVHDDNCRALGGVAGHAGLFGTAEAVLALCENIVLQYLGRRDHPSYSTHTLQSALKEKQGAWRFGFDTPSAAKSSSGRYFSELSIGHLGFTGTSFWIDLPRGIAVVFLTNRVLGGADLNPIKKLRPLVHDTIMKDLIKKSG